MARRAPASRLSRVSPDVCTGTPCGRAFARVYACTPRAIARVRTCTRTAAVNIARALLLHGCLPRCLAIVAPISLRYRTHRSNFHDPSTPLPFDLQFFPFHLFFFPFLKLLLKLAANDTSTSRIDQRERSIFYTPRVEKFSSVFLTLPIFMVLAFPIYVRRLSIESLKEKEEKKSLIWNSNGDRYDRWIEAESRHVEDP